MKQKLSHIISMNTPHRSSVIKTIQEFLLGFIASTSITSNREYKDEMRFCSVVFMVLEYIERFAMQIVERNMHML